MNEILSLENQVTSFELSEKLDKLKLPLESFFRYVAYENPTINHFKKSDIPNSYWMLTHIQDKYSYGNRDFEIRAYTASELLTQLPTIIDTKQNEPFNFFRINISRSRILDNNYHSSLIYSIQYFCDTLPVNEIFRGQLFLQNQFDEILANSCAKTLLYIHENGKDWELIK